MKIFVDFLNIIYPPRCRICGSFLRNENTASGICSNCANSFKTIEPPICSICGIPFISQNEDNHLCERCIQRRPFYDELRAPWLYENRIMDAVHRMKYSDKPHIAKALAPLLTAFANMWLTEASGMTIIPVPLHPQKLRQRGYNQSLFIARELAQGLNSELDFLSLRRTRNTMSQTGLNTNERRKNVKNAFEITEKKYYKDKSVILVDDVATTGSTINECAKALKKAGCKKVYGLVLARTPS